LTRTAASSIASGKPSTRAQISATARAFSVVSAKSSLTARARSTNSATAASCASTSTGGRRCRSGSASGATGHSCSPERRSTTRLVTSTFNPVHPVNNSAMRGAASTRCSKLSRSSSSCLSRKVACTRSISGCPPISLTLNVCAMVATTRSGSLSGASGTKKTPSANISRSTAPACKASRVLPMPPGPVSVSSRTSGRRSMSRTAATSRSRPISGVGGTGRLVGGAPCNWGARSGVAAECECGRPGRLDWTASGRARAPTAAANGPLRICSYSTVVS